ncbi:unnamed protein product [Psylliodes chrysocephalus]|uniref:Uncharacterized protein n=1 Tax=Psylliodes chrysocephalus TaxID=3402493 RepID=A0A9P0CST9_9CUCU|nr:unnamed protein product [Psylliodes chrysocephala]
MDTTKLPLNQRKETGDVCRLLDGHDVARKCNSRQVSRCDVRPYLLGIEIKLRLTPIITVFIEELKQANIMSQQSVADADVDIVLKAIETASGNRNNEVVIVSEDTEVLTMLAAPNLEVFLLKPPSARVPDGVYSSESLTPRSACIRFHILFLGAIEGK